MSRVRRHQGTPPLDSSNREGGLGGWVGGKARAGCRQVLAILVPEKRVGIYMVHCDP